MKKLGQSTALLLVFGLLVFEHSGLSFSVKTYSKPVTLDKHHFVSLRQPQFRDIFAACVNDQKKGSKVYSAKDLHQLIYIPVSMISEPSLSGTKSPDNQLKILDQQFKGISPVAYYKKSKQQPFAPVKCQSIHRHPLTVIVLPGIFGEFSHAQPFDEFFSKSSKSIAGKKWRKAVRLLPANDTRRLAKSYVANLRPFKNLKENDIVIPQKSILDAIRVTSIDRSPKYELARLVNLYPRKFSSESIGTLHDNSRVFINRLNKYFQIMGTPKRIIFIGYSRGTPVALQMLVDAKTQHLPWLKNVKALVSIGGVVWGSALADDVTNNPHSKTYQFLTKLRSLSKSLNVIERTDLTFGQKVRRVTLAYAKFSAIFLKIGRRAGNPLGAVKMAGILDKKAIKEITKVFIKRHIKLLSRPVNAKEIQRNYINDVVKFREFIRNVLTGIDSITTQERLRWFKNNKLPKHVRYLTIAATMASGALGANRHAYNAKGFDYRLLIQSWKKYTRISGISFGDSQVSVNRTIFWPKLIQSLNHSNSQLKTQVLGVMGVHHWGLVLQQAGTKGVNPFPREAMLRALVHYLNSTK